MPIEPPNPHLIMDVLRAVIAELQRQAERSPADERLAGALADVKSALAKLEPASQA